MFQDVKESKCKKTMATEMQYFKETGFKIDVMYREKFASHTENYYFLEKVT